MNETLYTEENRQLVGEWLDSVLFWKEEVYAKAETKVFKNCPAVPQYIREALAREGFDLCQRPFLTNAEVCIYSSATESLWAVIKWDKKTDPTARHALWDAVVKLLKGREE